jgi:hypothetical protein
LTPDQEHYECTLTEKKSGKIQAETQERLNIITSLRVKYTEIEGICEN